MTALTVSLCAGAPAFAQLQAENGIKVGEGRLHPYVDLEARFDSAAWVAPDAPNEPPSPELLAHVRPGFRLEVPSNTLAVGLSGYADYVAYTGLLTPASTAASHFEGGANLLAAVNKGGQVGFNLSDTFSRTDRTNNVAVTVGVLSLANEVKGELPIIPGGGALEIVPSAAYGVEFFSSLVPGSAPNLNLFDNGNLRFGLAGRYKFLPKTAFVLDSTFGIQSYFNGGPNLPASLLKAKAGLAGLISPKIAVLATVGWGQNFAGEGGQTVIGHAELSYLLTEKGTIKFGYLRNLAPVPQYGIYGDDRGYVDASLMFGERLRLIGYAAFDYLNFYGAGGRVDTQLTLTLGPDYQFLKWLRGGVGYNLTNRTSTNDLATLNFTRNEAYLRVTFEY